MGRNTENLSGVSWKLWKIERRGRSVAVFWGPAVLRRRKVEAAGGLQSRTRRFTTSTAAKAFEVKRIREKVRTGYERRPRTVV